MRRIGDGKKGQQMTLGTIILMVLGVAVLVLLIFGFSTGWKNMWSKVTMYTSEANVEDKIADCENDCSLNEESAWCNQKKNLRFFDNDGKIVKVEGTCQQFESGAFEGYDAKILDGEATKDEVAKDKILHDKIVGLNFPSCSSFTCSAAASKE